MPTCPRCQQSVASQAIACPTCHMPLKAFGHPGMSIQRAMSGQLLCDTCIYHLDDSCTFPKRPQATECTLYLTTAQAARFQTPPGSNYRPVRWSKRTIGLGAIALMVGLSLLLAIATLAAAQGLTASLPALKSVGVAVGTIAGVDG